MSSTKVLTNVRIESDIKQKALMIANQMGLSFSTIMSLLLRRFIMERKIEIGIDTYEKAFDEGIKQGIKESHTEFNKLDVLLSKMNK